MGGKVLIYGGSGAIGLQARASYRRWVILCIWRA